MNSSENIFHNVIPEEEDFIAKTFPIVWRKELPDLTFELSSNSIKIYNNINKTKTLKEDTVSFSFCEIILHTMDVVNDKNTDMQDPIFDIVRKIESYCNKNITPSYIEKRIFYGFALCVIYGIPITTGQKSLKKQPIGFAMLFDYKNLPKIIPYNAPYGKPEPKVNKYIYIDAMCSAYSTAGIGSTIIKYLEDPILQKVIYENFDIQYDGIALKALPATYTYFISKFGFVRSNGDGFVYPFAMFASIPDNSKSDSSQVILYNSNDIDKLSFPSKWYSRKFGQFTARNLKEFFQNVQPLQIFIGDNDDNGYLLHKPIQKFIKQNIGGKSNKKYIHYCGDIRKYLVHKNNIGKFIKSNGKQIQLSTIRGKYRYS
jgi:hypothetical protein